jgi:hypothetical protein
MMNKPIHLLDSFLLSCRTAAQWFLKHLLNCWTAKAALNGSKWRFTNSSATSLGVLYLLHLIDNKGCKLSANSNKRRRKHSFASLECYLLYLIDNEGCKWFTNSKQKRRKKKPLFCFARVHLLHLIDWGNLLMIVAGKKNPFEMLGPDLNLEQELPAGVVVVDMHFVGSHHIVVEQLQQTQYPFMGKKKSLVEAAAVASFGSSENLVNFFGHTGGGSPGVNSEASSGSSDAGLSPPGSFPYEMYQFLARKVTSPGGDRAARKQQRRERDRAFSQGRHRCEPEHFVKIVHCCPTAARPLQGLWKVQFQDFDWKLCTKSKKHQQKMDSLWSLAERMLELERVICWSTEFVKSPSVYVTWIWWSHSGYRLLVEQLVWTL